MTPSTTKTVTFTASELEILRQAINSAIFKAETSLEATKTLLTIETKLSADTCPSCGSPIPSKKELFTVDHDKHTRRFIVKTHLGTTVKAFNYLADKASAAVDAYKLCEQLNA